MYFSIQWILSTNKFVNKLRIITILSLLFGHLNIFAIQLVKLIVASLIWRFYYGLNETEMKWNSTFVRNSFHFIRPMNSTIICVDIK